MKKMLYIFCAFGVFSCLTFTLSASASPHSAPDDQHVIGTQDSISTPAVSQKVGRKLQGSPQDPVQPPLPSTVSPQTSWSAPGRPGRAGIEDYLTELRACLRKGANLPITLGILGVREDETRVSAKDRQTLRREVEKHFSGRPDVKLKAVADMDRILQRLQAVERFSQKTVRAALAKAQDADAFIYIEIRQVSINGGYRIVNYDLRGITRKESCMAVTSAQITSRLRMEEIHDFAALAKNHLRHLLDKHREIRGLAFRQFNVRGSYATECSHALPKRLIGLVGEIEDSPKWMANGRVLEKKIVAPPVRPEVGVRERAFVTGELHSISGVPIKQAMRLDMMFMRGGAGGEILGSLSAWVSNLGCDTRPINFEEKIMAAARHGVNAFRITSVKTRVRPGSPVAFDIWSRKNVHVHCMVIDLNDRSGYILFPSPRTNSDYTLKGGETRRYPEGFGFASQTYKNISNNFFGCFATAKPLSGNARMLWDAMSARLLKQSEINLLLEELRAVEDIVEHWAKVEVARQS